MFGIRFNVAQTWTKKAVSIIPTLIVDWEKADGKKFDVTLGWLFGFINIAILDGVPDGKFFKIEFGAGDK